MSNSNALNIAQIAIGDPLIDRVSEIAHQKTGVQLGSKQKVMIASRVSKRILELNLKSDQEYLDFIEKNLISETQVLISMLTTHHTYFFREFSHFQYLEQTGLKMLVDQIRPTGRKVLRVWSAACSRGQEVYSLSMFLSIHLKRIAPDFTYEILGTDVDPQSVKIAANGVYQWDEIKEAPAIYLEGAWQRGTGDIAHFVKAKDSLKKPCTFRVGNLFDLKNNRPPEKMDLIFCRNVFIYFKPSQIEEIVQNFSQQLSPEGVLIIGLSESIRGMNVPFENRGPSIFQLKGTSVSKSTKASTSKPVVVLPTPEVQRLIRVLCVDDSPTVLALLKKILTKEQGFEIVETAKSGLDAARKLKGLNIDAMTLDIHMPEQTGLEYLRKNFNSNHPPVVMISSVSREDSDLALHCLDAGAVDYVEKPALADIERRGEEIRSKLFCAVHAKQAKPIQHELEHQFENRLQVTQPDQKARVIFAGYPHRDSIRNLLSEWGGGGPPIVILTEGQSGVSGRLVEALRSNANLTVVGDLPQKTLKSGEVYIVDLNGREKSLTDLLQGKKVSMMALGPVSQSGLKWSDGFKQIHWLMDERLQATPQGAEIKSRSSDMVPATSFGYLSDRFLK